MMRKLKPVLVVAALAASAFGAAAPAESPKLTGSVPEIRFEATSLSDAIDFIRDAGKLNVRVDWKTLELAGIDKTTPITFRLRGVTLRKALETILREAGGGGGATLTYTVSEGIVEITTQEQADKKLITEVYDIRDLMFVPLDAGQAPDIQFQLDATTKGGGGGGGNLFSGGSGGSQQQDKPADARGQEIATIISETIRPEVWTNNGGPATIRYFNGTLIVTAPQSVHDQLGHAVRP